MVSPSVIGIEVLTDKTERDGSGQSISNNGSMKNSIGIYLPYGLAWYAVASFML